jgi:hypothetical protein
MAVATVVTVGFPNIGLQGFAPKLSRGEIGSLAGPQDDARYFQISVPIDPPKLRESLQPCSQHVPSMTSPESQISRLSYPGRGLFNCRLEQETVETEDAREP